MARARTADASADDGDAEGFGWGEVEYCLGGFWFAFTVLNAQICVI